MPMNDGDVAFEAAIVEDIEAAVAPIAQALEKIKWQWEESTLAQALTEVMRQWGKHPVFQELTKFSTIVEPYAKAWIRYNKIADTFRETGWLPYHSAPFHYVEECGQDIQLLENRLSNYYRTHWGDIRQDIESRLGGYLIDKEAKDAMHEAMNVYEAKFYRSVCRLLFPEMERVFRVRFFDNRTGNISSQRIKEELTQGKTLENFVMGNPFGLVLFGQIVQHLYERVTEENRKNFEKATIPNRHAAIHGLAIYSSMKQALNMIFMTDYVFQIVSLGGGNTTPISPQSK